MIISPSAISPYKIPTFQSVGEVPFSFGNALQFDGVNDYVSVVPIFQNNNIFTVNCWFKFTTIGTSRKYIIDEGSGSFYRTAIALNFGTTGKVGAKCRNSGTEVQLESTTTIVSDTWYFISFVYNSTTDEHFLYINGVEEDSSTVNAGTPTGSAALYFGNAATNLSLPADVTLDEVSIYNTSLISSEITSLFNSGNGNLATNYSPESLIAYWRMNESGTDTVAVDETGTYNGTLNNFPTSGMWVAH